MKTYKLVQVYRISDDHYHAYVPVIEFVELRETQLELHLAWLPTIVSRARGGWQIFINEAAKAVPQITIRHVTYRPVLAHQPDDAELANLGPPLFTGSRAKALEVFVAYARML